VQTFNFIPKKAPKLIVHLAESEARKQSTK